MTNKTKYHDPMIQKSPKKSIPIKRSHIQQNIYEQEITGKFLSN